MYTSENIKILLFHFQNTPNTIPLQTQVIPYMDLTYLLAGEMVYYINGEKVVLHAGDAVLFPPGSSRQRPAADKPVRYVSFNVQMYEPYKYPLCGHISKCVRSNTEYLLELFEKEWKTFSVHKEEKCIALFSYLLYRLLEITCDRENPHVKNIKQYVNNNLTSTLMLEEIAGAVHLSPNYCSSIFKKQTGVSLMQYILQQRLDLAKRFIVTTDLPLHIIAEKCGFEDYNYFSHAFKKYIKMTATQYKNKKMKDMKSQL